MNGDDRPLSLDVDTRLKADLPTLSPSVQGASMGNPVEAQIQSLMAPASPPTTGQQVGGMLQGLSAGFLGQPDPRIAQQDAELKHKLELIRLQQSVERQRVDKTKLQLSIAKDLWDSAPELALKQYESSGLVKFSPEERQQALEGKQAAQIPHRMEAVLGALDANIDPRTLPPTLTHGLNIPALQAMPKAVRNELAPDRRKKIADALAAETKTAFEQARLARDKRIEAGAGTPADLQLAGAKTPEDIGQRLMTQSITSGLPVPPEYQPFLKAYDRERQLKGLSGPARLAMKAAQGDPVAAAALRRLKEATTQQRGAGDEATQTQTERPIAITDINRKNYDTMANEISARLTQQGVLPNDPSPTVTYRGQAIPKNVLIEEAYAQANPGQRVQVQWNGKNWVVVRAWETLKQTRTRTKATAGPLAAPSQSERRGPLSPPASPGSSGASSDDVGDDSADSADGSDDEE